MVNVGPLTADTGWRVWGTPANVNGFAFGLVTAEKSLNGSQANFERCLPVCWACILYIHFQGLLPHNSARCKIDFASKSCVLLFWQRYCTLEQWASAELRHGTMNGIMELSLLIIFNRGRHLYSEGCHHVGHRPTFHYFKSFVFFLTSFTQHAALLL